MEQSSSSSSFPRQFWSPLPQKEWMKLIRRCLMFLSERDPPIESNLYKTERQILPDAFLESRGPLQYCYAFKGNFLPSGNLDGRVWKPSQGARPTGDGLMKRYFYYKEGSFKIKRQVIWLTNNENWCFLDYRCNLKGKIKLDQILLPHKFEFVKLVRAVEEYLPIPSEINERKRKLEKAEERELSLTVHTITKCEEQYSKAPTSMNTAIVTSPNAHFGLSNVESLDPLMNSYYDVFSQDSLNLELEEFDFQLSNMDQLGEPASSFELLPPLSDFVKEEPQEFSSSIVPKRRKLEESPLSPTPAPSYSFSAIDYLINHLLSYEQILDTICQSICTQLVFNRSFFKKMGKDAGMLLHEVIQKCSVMTVDLMEFPGSLMSSFFGWLYESLWRKPPIDMPDVYCIICGKSNREPHDVHAHTSFFTSLDSNLVGAFKAKANNFYALVKEMVAFLLKYPNSRLSFQYLVEDSVHCPFCSKQGGLHNPHKHDVWKRILCIDQDIVPKEPEKTDNLETYIKSAFDFIMFNVHYTIPSFLFNLHNVQSFLECLVTLWKCLKI